MKTWAIAVICLIAISLWFVPQAKAQCPSNPLSLLDGTSWAFQYEDVFDNAVGIFTAHVNLQNFAAGVLNITMTSVHATNGMPPQTAINRLQQFQGRYQVYPDCSGGELLFNTNGNSFQFEFVFVGGQSEMYFVSDSTSVPNNGAGQKVGAHGRAKLTPQLGCPAGLTSPLQLLAGTTWGFHTSDLTSASAGVFTASISAGGGALAVTETATFLTNSNQGNVVRLATGGGRYQVYSDCSGGELLFNIAGLQAQYEFVFVDGGNEMFFVNDSSAPGIATVGNSTGVTLASGGGAKKQ